MNKRLGRGLDALFLPLDVREEDRILDLPIDKLRPNPYQPRKTFNEEALKELSISVKEHGVLQPIIVRVVLKDYEIIAGERRWRAAKLSGMTTIPAVVREISDQQAMEIALIENVQREDLNCIEIATAYYMLVNQLAITQEQLAERVGKSRSQITNYLRILQLPDSVKDDVSRGTLSMGHARSLAGIKHEKTLKELARRCVAEEWSVRRLEEEINNLDDRDDQPSKKNEKKTNKDPYIMEAENELQERFGATIHIKYQKNGGKIEFIYHNEDDLNRLLEQLISKK